MTNVRYFSLVCLSFATLADASVRTPQMPVGHEAVGPRKKLAYERNKEESEREKKKAAFEEKQKKRKRRPRSLTPKIRPSRTSFRDMSIEQLREKADIAKNNNDLSTATVYLKELTTMCHDGFQENRAAYLVELADLYFDQGDYAEAAKQYNEFLHIYSGNAAVEHATYRAIVCCSKAILSPDRDQTKTEETLALADKFLERGDFFTTYQDEVRAIKQRCIDTLAAAELGVIAYNINAGDFKAAQQRVKYAHTEWLPKAPDIALKLADLETDLAEQFPEFKPITQNPALAVTTASLKQPKKIDLAARF